MPWSAKDAVAYIQGHALAVSHGRCAHAVREAVDAGGVTIAARRHAENLGESLSAAGFLPVPSGMPYEPGDVAIIHSIPRHPDGHACMFDGKQWISDFRQERGMYPGPDYRTDMPPFVVYRHR